MKISKREKILLLIAAYLLIIYCGFDYIYAPVKAEFASLQTENQQLKQEVKTSAQFKKDEYKKLASMDHNLDEYNQLNQELPTDPHFVEMVALLESLSDKWRVNLESINYNVDSKQQASGTNVKTEQKTIKGVSAITYNIVVSGRYYQLLTYLQQLEHAPRIISIDSVSIAAAQKNNTPAQTTPSLSQNGADNAPLTAVNIMEASGQPVFERDKYDINNLKMTIQMTAYYSIKNSSYNTNNPATNYSINNPPDNTFNSSANRGKYTSQENKQGVKQEG